MMKKNFHQSTASESSHGEDERIKKIYIFQLFYNLRWLCNYGEKLAVAFELE